MQLPVLDVYTSPVTLPSTQQVIDLRPYLVREEKLLLMSQESNNPNDQVEAVAQVVRNCTDGVVEPKISPYFDVEYLLLQLRSRSVGEMISPTYQCQQKRPGSDEVCGHTTVVPVNLSEISVTGVDRDDATFVVPVSDKYTLRLRYPTIYTVNDLLMMATTPGATSSTLRFMGGLCDLFDTLEDRTTGQTYQFDDFTKEDKIKFLESMTPAVYQKLTDFLNDMPVLTHTSSYVCESCGFHHAITMTGLADFLV